MESPKKPSKQPSLPSQDEARRTNVLFEKLMSEFRTFGEVQSDLRDRVGRMETDLHTVKEDVTVLKLAVRSQGETLRSHGEDLSAIKSNVAEIKADLKKYNERLEVVEAKV